MKVMVLGAISGMLAQDIIMCLEERGISYIPVMRKDIVLTSAENVYAFIQEHAPTHCINTIAYTQVDTAQEDAENALIVNALFAEYVAKACYSLNIELIHYSTDFVFDGKAVIPYIEEDIPNPQSIYGATKLEGEKRIIESGAKAYILRTAWLFGLGKNNFITKILSLVQERGSISVVANQYGCPTYTRHLAIATMDFLDKKPPYGLYHVTGSGEASWYAFASYAVELYNAIQGTQYIVRPILSEEFPQKAQRPPYSVLNTKKYTQHTGNYMPHWREATKEYIRKYVE